MRFGVIIIGGGHAGMAAALQLLRARRQVLIIDAGCGGTGLPAIHMVSCRRTVPILENIRELSHVTVEVQPIAR
ncbi:hypothetical protein BLM14_25830 (plasmid) [Phyllobacterium zundukense]|nr:hypothetical protein BLM14_25830 [Phyllobacterium zundukense]